MLSSSQFKMIPCSKPSLASAMTTWKPILEKLNWMNMENSILLTVIQQTNTFLLIFSFVSFLLIWSVLRYSCHSWAWCFMLVIKWSQQQSLRQESQVQNHPRQHRPHLQIFGSFCLLLSTAGVTLLLIFFTLAFFPTSLREVPNFFT